jgi:hypothetical protein
LPIVTTGLLTVAASVTLALQVELVTVVAPWLVAQPLALLVPVLAVAVAVVLVPVLAVAVGLVTRQRPCHSLVAAWENIRRRQLTSMSDVGPESSASFMYQHRGRTTAFASVSRSPWSS